MGEIEEETNSSCCGFCLTGIGKVVSCICCLIFGCVSGVLIWNFAFRVVESFDLEDFTNVLDNLTDIDWADIAFDEDPFVGDNTTDEWRSPPGQPLQLEIWNALDRSWQKEFDESVSDWDESAALVLTTERVNIDRECTSVEGVMKVCNANYGETGWAGINEIQLTYESQRKEEGYITSSVAKLNEYYLRNADYAKRLYTMCHELGHGFGLPHTDENFNNPDLGNCLDYTDSPENNLRPGEMNFARLRQMYLNASSRSNSNNAGASDGTTGTIGNNFEVIGEEQSTVGPDGRLLLHARLRGYLYAADLGFMG